ncbi:MAG: hypothetical protein TREMPRED_000849 [Tremellales sp. Tagirdzhanova-0007]|nr:MAG: hypothetical protein TREMPRED_000849 [Tremellales sp. Tagirdzhanova-0007]
MATRVILASSSRTSQHTLPLVRLYATRPAVSDNSTDSRNETIRRSLYPPNTFLPQSASPTGAHHAQHLARVAAVIHSPEVYETIERAWKLYQRHRRELGRRQLTAKFGAMEDACDALDELTGGAGASAAGGGGGRYERLVYTRAMARPDPYAEEKITGRSSTPESRWREARVDGLVPREAWVPTETRGKGWDYEWKRPSSIRS